jgi:glucose-6-phosphate isomerase
MITKNVEIEIFKIKKKNKSVKKNLQLLLTKNNEIFSSLSNKYIDKFKIKKIRKLIERRNVKLIGMGGSILGAKAIYSFLEKKVKKKFLFLDNLRNLDNQNLKRQNFNANIIISKSGNTLETIINTHSLLKKKDRNIFITENNNNNYLRTLAYNLKSEIVDHNNYIGGRYSVLSEVGMLPAELMGFKSKNFRQFNNLIRNKKFLDTLISNVETILFFVKNNKNNSIIINYDESLNSFFEWYQQLVAESLGKKNTGILPIISNMPKDNHSLMQLYLDGTKNNFYSIFISQEKIKKDFKKLNFLYPYKYLKKYDINKVLEVKKKATENVFRKKKIPFRSFLLKERNEKTMGELFCYFILETILIGKCLGVNPYDQPSVELIKNETKKYFI